jgi:uncharacterized membrane protein
VAGLLAGLGSTGFTVVDAAAAAFFAVAWIGYHHAVERSTGAQRSLNRLMKRYRYAWADQIAGRDNRIVDTTINASLQNGTAFFASTSLIALGGVLTLLRSSEEALAAIGLLTGEAPTRLGWEIKVVGLAVIFTYAFFKFAWSYRLFNYAAILIGAVPLKGADEAAMRLATRRMAAMNTAAGLQFNQGQRAFFFALAYLGWFLGAPVLFATTALALYVMWRRQFASDARRALLLAEDLTEDLAEKAHGRIVPER